MCGAALAVVLGGCPEGDDAVPFKHDDPPEAPAEGEITTSGEGPAPETRPDVEARSHDGGAVVRLKGGELELPGARASLTLPLDDDEFHDALVWAGSDDEGYSLWRSLGGEDGFGDPHAIDRSTLQLPESDSPCSLAEARLSPLGDEKAWLYARLDCPPDDPEAPRDVVMVLGLSSSPRVLERFSLRLGDQAAPLELSEVKADDVDGDGHGDVQLVLRSSAAATDVPLTWLDRPSGLARDTSEPEATLAELASQAEQQMKAGEAAAAGETAARVLAVHAQLCREAGRPQLGVAGSWGLRCGESKAVARAALVAIRARAAEGDVLGAFDALDALERDGAKADPKARAEALKALSRAAETPGYQLVPVVNEVLAAQAALPPRLRLTEDLLWAGSVPPRIWNPATRGELPSLDATSWQGAFQDPSGHFRVGHIDRDCEGRLVRLYGDDGSTVRARVRQDPRVEGCALRLPVPDAGDLRVLGWPPQGVVLADREGAVLVPLDSRARPTEGPRRLPLETPLPAPLPQGRAAPGGECYVLPTPHGVLLRRHGEEPGQRLIRPPGWTSLDGAIRDAVVDGSCERFAIATSSAIYLILPASNTSAGATGAALGN